MGIEKEIRKISVSEVTEICQQALKQVGASPQAVKAVTAALVWCELRGISSHGLNMLPIYMERASKGGIHPDAHPQLVHECGGLIRMDGNGTFGQYIAQHGTKLIIEKAKTHGISLVSIFKGNHAGALGFFTQQIAAAGLIGFMVHNSNPAVAPFGGCEAILGTNPLSFAFPNDRFPVLVDMATSATAKGKLYELAHVGDQIPEGLALNAQGEATTSLKEALNGILLPLGGAKGYSLAVAVEMLTGVLAGGLLGPETPSFHQMADQPQNVSMLMMAFDVAAIIPLEEYRERAGKLAQKLTSSAPTAGVERVWMPGETEARRAEEREKEGIPIKVSILEEIEMYTRER